MKNLNRLMKNLKKLKRSILLGALLSLVLLTFVVVIRSNNKNRKERILYELYLKCNPSLLNRLFNHVPRIFKENTKITILEKFNSSEIICVQYSNYSFPVSNLYLVTKDNGVIDFNSGKLIGDNVRIYFNVNAFNFYIKQTCGNYLDENTVLEKMFKFLGNGCENKVFYVLKDSTDINRVLKEVNNSRNLFRKTKIDYNSIFLNKYGIVLWHNSYGIIRVSLLLNSDFTIKYVMISRIGYLGNENINL